MVPVVFPFLLKGFGDQNLFFLELEPLAVGKAFAFLRRLAHLFQLDELLHLLLAELLFGEFPFFLCQCIFTFPRRTGGIT